MATNIPPHNICEVIDGTIHLIDNPDATIRDLMKFIKGARFPHRGDDLRYLGHNSGLYDRGAGISRSARVPMLTKMNAGLL
jgi:DNA gyrase/topoisomerase IV subunit A